MKRRTLLRWTVRAFSSGCACLDRVMRFFGLKYRPGLPMVLWFVSVLAKHGFGLAPPGWTMTAAERAELWFKRKSPP